MKTYRVCTSDVSKGFPPHNWPTVKYIKGLSAARSAVPVKLHYSRNAKAFYGFDGAVHYYVIECR